MLSVVEWAAVLPDSWKQYATIQDVGNIRSTVSGDCFFQPLNVISRLSSVGRAYDCNRYASHCMVAGSIPAVEKTKFFPDLNFFVRKLTFLIVYVIICLTSIFKSIVLLWWSMFIIECLILITKTITQLKITKIFFMAQNHGNFFRFTYYFIPLNRLLLIIVQTKVAEHNACVTLLFYLKKAQSHIGFNELNFHSQFPSIQ
jgi:hypothetical protein